MSRNFLNDKTSYGLVAVLIHWLTALAVIGLYPLGLYIESLDYYDPAYRTIPVWHKSVGIIVAVMLLVRLAWRFIDKPPAPLPQPELLQKAAKLTHILLYVLLALTALSGYLISTADGTPIEFFNWVNIPALPIAVEQQEDIAGEVHFIVATLLISLAAVHAAAAIKHHFIDKDRTLKRMLAIQEDHQ
ncbi:MAG: cytochrome b [Neptuniibacter sp.]